MLELTSKFKQALGNGVRTSLYPLVKIYKGVRIDDPEGNQATAWEDAEQINLSIKETNISGSAYKPLLLSSPSIMSKADIINNKFTISSLSLSISNAPFKGKIFSDDVQSLLNAVCQVYYCSNGIDSIDDCLLVYTGTIRRFSQSAETIKLELEDFTQQMLSTKIPSTTIPDEINYKKDDIGKPYPMVYGQVDKSPTIIKYSVNENTPEEFESIANFILEKPEQAINGIWNIPRKEIFNNSNLENTLIKNVLSDDFYLYVYDKKFLPINQKMPSEDGWSHYYEGSDTPYQTTELADVKLYDFSSNISNGPNIIFTSQAIQIVDDIAEFTETGIPTRIYRPITGASFYVKNNNKYTNIQQMLDSENKVYGFDYKGGWNPADEYVIHSAFANSGNYNPNDDSPAKDEYAQNVASGNQTWWEPEGINQLTPPEEGSITLWSDIDTNTQSNFPVNFIQDGNDNTGLHITSQNFIPDWNEYPNSGIFVKLTFDEIGSFDCVTKSYYQVRYYKPQNLGWGLLNEAGPQTNHILIHSAIWFEPILQKDIFSGDYLNINSLQNSIQGQGYIPNSTDTLSSQAEVDNGDSSITNGGYAQFKGNQVSELFKQTTEYNSVQWGVKNLYVNVEGVPRSITSCIANLNQYYLIQDILIKDILNKDYYASVKGRVSESLEGVRKDLGSATHFGWEGVYWWSTLRFLEPHNLSSGDLFELYKSNDEFKGEYTVSSVTNEYDIRIDSENLGDCDNGYVIVKEPAVIRTAPKIMEDILKDELGYDGEVHIPDDFDLFKEQYKVNNDFTLNEQKEAREVFEGLFESSLAIPSYNEKGQFKLIPIHQLEIDSWEEYQANGTQAINSNAIDNEHILKYSFSLTKLEDVKNQVNVKYKKNYASGDFDAETGYIFYDVDGNQYESYEQQSELNYPNDPTKHYSLDYYGLKSEETKLEVETEYIRDSISARKLQKRLLNWYANQHLIVKVDLPVTYMNLEVGDYIHFKELVGGKKAFGYDYTRHYNKNGQVAYKYFFITKISKSLDKVSIEGVQVHRGEYGFWGSWDDFYGDDTATGNNGFDVNDILDEGDNDGDLNFDIEEDEEDETIEEEDKFVNLYWANITPQPEFSNNNINDNPILVIDTNLIGEFDYTIWISNNSQPFEYGDRPLAVLPSAPPAFELSGNYITVNENYFTNINGDIQGGTLQLKSDFSPPDQEHGNIEGYISLTHPDLNQSATLSFFQNYTADPEEPVILAGDVNFDGTRNILDIAAIVNHIISDENLEGDALIAADLNEDNLVNVQDILSLVNIILLGEG